MNVKYEVCHFNTIVGIEEENEYRVKKVEGFIFGLNKKIYFLRHLDDEWWIICPYTGLSIARDPSLHRAVGKIRWYVENQKTQYIEIYHGEVEKLKKAGIKIPVNDVSRIALEDENET